MCASKEKITASEPSVRDFEAELRKIWDAQGVPQEKQNALIEGIAAKARPGAQVGPFTVTAKRLTDERI